MSRIAMIAGAVCGLVLAIAGGALLGRHNAPKPSATRVLNVGPASLVVPRAWRSVSATRSSVVSVASGGERVVVKLTPLSVPVGATRETRLAGFRAWRQGAVSVLPTSGGNVTVTCSSCAGAIESISVSGAHILDPSSGLPLALRASQILNTLDQARAQGRDGLRRARTPADQRRWARRLAAAHAEAAAALRPVAGAALLQRLSDVRRAYSELDDAAGAGSTPRFDAARSRISSAETELARAVDDIAPPKTQPRALATVPAAHHGVSALLIALVVIAFFGLGVGLAEVTSGWRRASPAVRATRQAPAAVRATVPADAGAPPKVPARAAAPASVATAAPLLSPVRAASGPTPGPAPLGAPAPAASVPMPAPAPGRAPILPRPAAPALAANGQATNRPATPAPASNGHWTNKPATPTPTVTGQWTNQPAVPAPTSNGQATNRPAAPAPTAIGQGTSRPAAPTPAPNGQGTNQPAVPTPAPNGHGTNHPAVPAPAANGQATNQPAVPTPAPNGHGTNHPAVPAPAANGQATNQPAVPAPATNSQATNRPATPAPTADGRSTNQPATPTPATNGRSTNRPGARRPVTNPQPARRPAAARAARSATAPQRPTRNGRAKATPSAAVRDATWTCELTWSASLRSAAFHARATAPGEEPVDVARSGKLSWPPFVAPSADASLVAAARAVARALVEAGWTPTTKGSVWYAQRFAWARDGAPPALGTIGRAR